MHAPLRSLELSLQTDHGLFIVHDRSGTGRAGEMPTSERWVSEGQGQFWVCSFTSHAAEVAATFELWDAQPPPSDGWTEEAEFVTEFDSGVLSVARLTAGPVLLDREPAHFVLSGPGSYRVRALANGRGEVAAALVAGFDSAPEALNGQEKYCFQFWQQE